MTTIYVVTSGDYSDYTINAMFTTKEKADRYIARRSELNTKTGWGSWNDFRLEEWELDAEDDRWLRGEVDVWAIWFKARKRRRGHG